MTWTDENKKGLCSYFRLEDNNSILCAAICQCDNPTTPPTCWNSYTYKRRSQDGNRRLGHLIARPDSKFIHLLPKNWTIT